MRVDETSSRVHVDKFQPLKAELKYSIACDDDSDDDDDNTKNILIQTSI